MRWLPGPARTAVLAVVAGGIGLLLGLGAVAVSSELGAPGERDLGDSVVLDPAAVTTPAPPPGTAETVLPSEQGTPMNPDPQPSAAPDQAQAPDPATIPGPAPAPAPAPAPTQQHAQQPQQVVPAPPAPAHDPAPGHDPVTSDPGQDDIGGGHG